MGKIVKLFEEFQSKNQIDDICMKYGIRNYIINSDMSIDVNGNVNIDEKLFTKIPLRFNYVSGYFDCSNNELTSLEGCPNKVGVSFYCGHNKLENLEGCPNKVLGSFYCGNNQLISLEGSPKSVGGDFNCSINKLKSLEGCPKSVGGDFDCGNNQLISLDGSPKSVGGDFDCDNNPVHEVWKLINNYQYMEVFLDYDIIRDDNVIILDRLNDLLDLIGKKPSKRITSVNWYKCI